MFDFFNRKKLAAHVAMIEKQREKLIAASEARAAHVRRESELEQLITARNTQIRFLQKTAKAHRDRVTSHGMTDPERRFLAVCADIRKNNNMISQRRFNAAVDEINTTREQLKDIF